MSGRGKDGKPRDHEETIGYDRRPSNFYIRRTLNADGQSMLSSDSCKISEETAVTLL